MRPFDDLTRTSIQKNCLKKNKFKNGLSQQPLSGFHLEFKNFQGLEIKKTPPEV